jgi:hypothetical protein
MPGRWKLTRSEARTWARSDAVTAFRIPPSPLLRSYGAAVEEALASGDRGRVQLASQRLLDLFCRLLGVRPLLVEVCGVRPRNRSGELHGLYTPSNDTRARDRVQVWMHTAQRRQVVKFKTFLRTLLHELGHHLDYERLKLDHSFHTDGFYKRESSLVYAVVPRPTAARPPARPALAPVRAPHV